MSDLGNTPGTHPEVAERSLGDLVGDLTGDLSRLVRQEIALAKAEAKEDVSRVGQGAGMFGGAGVAALLALFFLSLAVVYGLDGVMDAGWAALIVGVVWVIGAAVLALLGKSRIKQATPPLQETVETLKEDAQWAKRQSS